MELFYKILPALLALLSGLAFTGILIYEKGSAISILRWAIWLIWVCLLFAILGFINSKTDSITTGFIVLLAMSFLMGILYLILAPMTLPWWSDDSLLDIFIAGLSLYFVGIAGYILTYNLLEHENPFQYLLLSGSPAFLLPALIYVSYALWMKIPALQYKTWSYPVNEPVPRLVPVETVRVMMNFTPVPGKNEPFEGYEVEYPGNTTLGQLFHYFISFHNKHREYRKKPIQFLSDNQLPLEWMLFKYSPQRKKIILDTEKTLFENDVKGNDIIYAISTNPVRS
ncbi:TssN family type VI secretion system protein [Dyadobacter psychrophilus]|uniref:Uncharacterized protein n=1 Tax=Dyadobacter psychrophilus TaxID=651661 RepID=A0A1T5BKE4_9BACT|nr:TssN family type VI secretion system protein [Dyadobacter psychrophilus]SKB47774.1 hypothetical protein SAMN05660293_00423 [Dyadobacter psychrophilus]